MIAAWPPAFVPSLHDPSVKPDSVGAAELPRPLLKLLRPIGHECHLWSQSAAQLAGRVSRDRLPPELSTFLQSWLPKTVPEMPVGDFTVLFAETSRGWQIASSSLPWLQIPAWTALLRLPALGSLWLRELRASHFEHLLQVLPQAWVVDAMPLPPGAVIPGLELPSWAALIRYHGQGPSFELHSLGGMTRLDDQQTPEQWQESLADAQKEGQTVLVERLPSMSWLLARYGRQEKEIHLAEAWLSQEDGIRRAHGI